MAAKVETTNPIILIALGVILCLTQNFTGPFVNFGRRCLKLFKTICNALSDWLVKETTFIKFH